ncbi:hypothetical protein Dda_7914 [Drechslerella dactyloides]|uniref:DUF300-domain-containing protein n=1 Tax=Drechslerella dactyloides TaxID=74499 RepID=A0AAD6IR62_DREDA|nr:hypothetical protein Dda_7914 [Drechslerella dactyloides]
MPGFLDPGGTGTKLGNFFILFSGCASIVATVLSVISIWFQLKNYRKPLLQRYVVRILLMVPIYAITSWLSLKSLTAAFFLDPIRDIYEAFTIYTFFQLLINFLGGERALIILTHGRAPTPHLWPLNHCLAKVDISDPHSFVAIKRGILQYAYLKPILAISSIIMKATDTYQEGYIGLNSGYFWSGIIYNLSVTISLYSLGMFWACMHKDLKPFRPVPKFLCIKLIIFASYWQGFFLSILVWLKVIPDTREYTRDNLAAAIQDCLICCEMPAFAIAHWYAFSWKDYADPTISAARMPVQYALRDAYGIRDLIFDTKATFVSGDYGYRNFDSVDSTTMAHPESAARMARIREGMRYERGGKGKYWIPKPSSNRTALLGAAGSAAGLSEDPAIRAANAGKSYGSVEPNDLEDSSLEEDVEQLYADARAMEFGDYNYPVITAHEPYSEERFRQNHQSSRYLVTTATNQEVLRPKDRIKIQSRRSTKSSGSKPQGNKGKGKASAAENGTTEESQGLLSQANDALHRSSSSSSNQSNQSGVVDLVVEDTQAEEIERVRARKEGGPGWNEEDPKVFVTQYPPEDAGEVQRTGFEPDDIPPPVDTREHHTDTSEVNMPSGGSQDNFVVAEEEDDDGNETPIAENNRRRGSSERAGDRGKHQKTATRSMRNSSENSTPTPTQGSGYSRMTDMVFENMHQQNPTITVAEHVHDPITMPQRPTAVRSHTCPTSSRNAGNGGPSYGPTLTIHDAETANELLGPSSLLSNGQYSFLNGSFIPRPDSGTSTSTSLVRRASEPGTLKPRPTLSQIHTHNRAAQSMGNLHSPGFTDITSSVLSPLSPVHRPSNPTVITIETRRDSVSTSTVTSMDDDSVQSVADCQAPQLIADEDSGVELTFFLEEEERVEVPPADCKGALERIKVAMEEKAALERRLMELKKLIHGKSTQHSPASSISSVVTPQREASDIQPSHTNIATDSTERIDESEEQDGDTSTRHTSFEDDASEREEPISAHTLPVPPQSQRQRPRLPQLQTSLPMPARAANEERQSTPSTAVRIASAVSRIANWFFSEEQQSAYPHTPIQITTPRSQRPQHASVQTFQFIQAHHLQLTPTSPQPPSASHIVNQRRLAHLSAPAAPASAPLPVVGYQQRWRPRNVEDVDPVPPYHEQDPNPSPGFVFFPGNPMLTPLHTPTSPHYDTLANQAAYHAV